MKNKILPAALLLVYVITLCACALFPPVKPGGDELTTLDGAYFTEPDFVDYSVTRVYYDTLSAPGQQAYRLIYNALFSQPEKIVIPPITLEELKVVVKALTDDNPHIIGLDNRFSYRKTDGAGVFLPTYACSAEECARRTAGALAEARRIADAAREKTGAWERELFVHDVLADAVSYEEGDNSADVYGALVEGKAVCEGYAYSMKLVLDMLGIPACVVRGVGVSPEGETEGHMWNLVDAGNGWRHLDLTWDDPVSEREQNLQHAYFNVGEELISANHSDYTLPAGVTVSADDKDDYYVRRRRVCGTDDCETVIEAALDAGDLSPEFRFPDEATLDLAVKVLFDSHGVYRLLPDPDSTVSYALDREMLVLHVYVS